MLDHLAVSTAGGSSDCSRLKNSGWQASSKSRGAVTSGLRMCSGTMKTRALLVLVLALLAAAPAEASFPGRDGLIAVSSEVLGSNSATIWVGRADGTGMRALPSPCPPGPLDLATRCYAAAPAWSRDGSQLAFTVVSAAEPQIWIVNADGTGLRQVPGAHGYGAAWSPDGSRLVFAADDTSAGCGLRRLFTVAPDGSGFAQVTRLAGDDPEWSVRGQIVFERTRPVFPRGREECELRRNVSVVTPGGRVRRIARAGRDPSWGPQGHAIVFLRANELLRMATDPGRRGPAHRLARGASLWEPAWSPSGRVVVFRQNFRLRAVGARRGRPVRIALNPPGGDFQPDWQSLPF